MWTKVEEIRDWLSPGEKSSLKQLGKRLSRPSIPFQHAERLITLGLVELSLGQLDLTIPGKQMLGVMSAHSF